MTISYKPSFTGYIKARISRGKDFRAVFIGPTGSGKSYACLKLAELLDETFSVDRIAFSPKEFMQIINSGALKRGSVIIFEEVGVNLSSRNWFSVGNKMLNYFFQTSRALGYITFLNTPDLSFLDSAVRKTLHACFEMKGINVNTKQSCVKPKLLQTNSISGKSYAKFLRVKTNDSWGPLDSLYLDMPSDELRQAYELKKRTFLDSLMKDIELELAQAEDKKASKRELTDKQQTIYDLLQNGKLISEIAIETGVTKSLIYAQMHLIEKKVGKKFEPIKEGNDIISYTICERV